MTLTSQLGEYFGQPEIHQPEPQLAEMKRLLIDFLGVALAGSRAESGRIAGDFVTAMGGLPQSTVVGRDVRVPAPEAAFANAIAEHSIELDDVDEQALFHYAPPVVSAVLAVAQAVNASGAQTLSAALAGCEVMSRVSRATNPALRDRGFHTTPTCGVFGAAVGAGRLLGVGGAQMTSALGLAGAQSGGLMEMYGTSMQKRINPGPAARGGVTAAMLARLGFTGADTIIEGERGFAAAFAGHLDADALLAGLGSVVPVTVEYKPYSAARPIHNAIDCALEIRAQGVALDDIASITVARHPSWARYHVINEPRTYHEAQVSLPYSVAVAFADGRALPEQYTDERVRNDEAVKRVSKLVTITEDPSLVRGVSCDMTVVTHDGRTARAVVDNPRGSVQRPLADGDLVAKFRMLGGPILPADRLDQIAYVVEGLDTLDDINKLLELTH